MKRCKAEDFNELVDLIGAGIKIPKKDREKKYRENMGKVVKTIVLWDGRIISGTLREDKLEADVAADQEIIWDTERLNPFVEKLVNDGRPMITKIWDKKDLWWTFEWTINLT